MKSASVILSEIFHNILTCLNYVSLQFVNEDIVISFGNDKDLSLDGVGEVNIRYSLFQSSSNTEYIGTKVKRNTIVFDILVSRISRVSEGEASYESLLLISEINQLVLDNLYSLFTANNDIENVLIDSTDYLPISFNGKNLETEGLNNDVIKVNGDNGFMVGSTFMINFRSVIDNGVLGL